MLPRLRFVAAAAFIAALPWIVFSSGIVSNFSANSVTDYSQPAPISSLAPGDLRGVRALYLMSYVRRSHELERLREMASAPLADWVAAPADESEPAPPPQSERVADATITNTTRHIEAAAAEPIMDGGAKASEPRASKPETTSELEVGEPAAGPSAAETAQRTGTVESSESSSPHPAQQAALSSENAVEIEAAIRPNFVPPLPPVRPRVKHSASIKHAIRRPRLYRARTAALQPPPPPPLNVFDGPPASPTTSNSFAQQYGVPK